MEDLKKCNLATLLDIARRSPDHQRRSDAMQGITNRGYTYSDLAYEFLDETVWNGGD